MKNDQPDVYLRTEFGSYPERLSKKCFLELLWLAVANGWKSEKISDDKAETAREKMFAAYLPPARVDAPDGRSLNEALKKASTHMNCLAQGPDFNVWLLSLLRVSEKGIFTIAEK